MKLHHPQFFGAITFASQRLMVVFWFVGPKHEFMAHALEEQSRKTPETSVELLLFISAPVRTEFHCEVHALVITSHTFFHLYNGVNHICHDVISQVSLSRDDVVFAVLEVPVSLHVCFLARPRFLFGCAANLYFTGLWSVCGWMLL